jgi:hypothetical protein
MSETEGTVTPMTQPPMPPGALWQPVVGEQATVLMERQSKLDTEARAKTLTTAASILSRGQMPTGPTGCRTGLVVGYVQSGKTLSFTTVIAMARDNGIPLVVVIAGTSVPLYNQTKDRLAADLQITADDIPPSWLHLPNADVNNEAIVAKRIKDWRDPERTKDEKATVLLTVMKNHHRLKNLDALLAKLDLQGVPAIIIDDEADQASLNTKIRQGLESPTYQKILSIKSRLSNHTFLQYTATPQAPLLINIIDALSPDFVEVLEPGTGYVGGLQFFGDDKRFAKVIPAADVPSKTNKVEGAPESLQKALAFFFVSVAAGLIKGRSKSNPNRSMLVHPTRTTSEHLDYLRSIESLSDDWLGLLRGPATEPDRADLIEAFRAAYNDLAATADDLPPFEEIVAKLPRALEETLVKEVNSRVGSGATVIEWNHAYGWILVGGQAMDRGFTVRELSMTYMPRGAGIGNADTLQQRARFFGYKRGYLGHCRLWLETDALEAFRAYVSHEEEMRAELIRLQQTGESLAGWKRRFYLDQDLKPCRRNVIEHDWGRGNYSNDWFYPRMAKMSQGAIDDNSEIVIGFLANADLQPDTSYVSHNKAQQHLVNDAVPLSDIRSKLLVDYAVQGAKDTSNYLGLMLQLERAIAADPNETGRVYHMRPGYVGHRGVDQQGRIPSVRRVHQGPTRAPGGYSYPGDLHFRDPDRITVQAHFFDLTEGADPTPVRKAVPILTIWVPKRLEADWVTQDQPVDDAN